MGMYRIRSVWLMTFPPSGYVTSGMLFLRACPAPLALVCVEVVQGLTEDENAVDGFQWRIALASHILTRANLEGSTIVMKAIDDVVKKLLMKAVLAPHRGVRTDWMMGFEAETQNISPLAWSIEMPSPSREQKPWPNCACVLTSGALTFLQQGA